MQSEPDKRPIYAIAGPTASGKTALGVWLSKLVDGEVVNFDSVQIYRGIEIATAKPSLEEMQGIPHHLIDYVDPNINYTAADWAGDATEIITEIEGRGRAVILVGGTGFYLRTLLQPLFESPKTDSSIRERLREKSSLRGSPYLHRLLSRIDPVAASKLFPNDEPRVMRALEFVLQTGELFSQRQPDRLPPPEFASRIHLFLLSPDRQELYARIDKRTQAHFDAGLVDEVRGLLALGVNEKGNALGAHGYRRVCEFLREERTLESAIEKSKQDVRNYAKRQLTWFRKEAGAEWLEGFGTEQRVWNEMETKIKS